MFAPRILLADDSATIRATLESMLGDHFEVLAVTDGNEAITAALEFRPQLILLDVVMPLIDGLSACRILRAREETATTPIILVTSQTDELDVEAGYAAGCTDYVQKPIDEHELLVKIDSWLAISDPAAEVA